MISAVAQRAPIRYPRIKRLSILSGLVAMILKTKLLRQRRPIFVGLYITNTCNLRCSYCFVNIDDRFSDPGRTGYSKDQVFKIVDELYEMGTRWIFLLGGEPLIHKDIGEIVRHIARKGILLHIITNGMFIERTLDDIQEADGVCVSIDGGEAATDAMRGPGTYRKAMRGAEVALARGMTVRIHAVINRQSMGDMEMLARLAKDMGITVTISPVTISATNLEATAQPELQLTKEEHQEFFRRYRRLKEVGYPIGNSFITIDKALHWPVNYNEFIKPGQDVGDYKPIPCAIAQTHGCIDAEGTLFNCIQRGCTDGLNIKDVGIRKAWDELPNRRKDCVSCSTVNTIELSAYLQLRRDVIMDGIRFFFKKRLPAASL